MTDPIPPEGFVYHGRRYIVTSPIRSMDDTPSYSGLWMYHTSDVIEEDTGELFNFAFSSDRRVVDGRKFDWGENVIGVCPVHLDERLPPAPSEWKKVSDTEYVLGEGSSPVRVRMIKNRWFVEAEGMRKFSAPSFDQAIYAAEQISDGGLCRGR